MSDLVAQMCEDASGASRLQVVVHLETPLELFTALSRFTSVLE